MPSLEELERRWQARLPLPLNIGPTISAWMGVCLSIWIAPIGLSPLLLVGWLAGDLPSPVQVFEWYYSYPVWLACLVVLPVLVVAMVPYIRPEQAQALYARRESGRYNGWLSRYVYWSNEGMLDQYVQFLGRDVEGDTFENFYQRSSFVFHGCGGSEQTVPDHYRSGHYRHTSRGVRYIRGHGVRGHTRNR